MGALRRSQSVLGPLPGPLGWLKPDAASFLGFLGMMEMGMVRVLDTGIDICLNFVYRFLFGIFFWGGCDFNWAFGKGEM